MSVREVTWSASGEPAGGLHRPGAGAPVVLLHGAGGSARTWASIMEAWPDADLWAVDLPGRGASLGPARDCTGEVAAWLLDGVAALELDRPVLVGHSYGGAVAMTSALARPDLVRGVAMVSSGARLRVAPAILQLVAEATDDRPYRLDAAFGSATNPAVIEAYHAQSRHVPARSTLMDWRACDSFDLLGVLAEVETPTLVLAGDDDVLTPPKHQARLAERLAHATLTMRPGIGHMLPWESPSDLVQAVAPWVEGLA